MYPHLAKVQFAMMVLVAVGGCVLGKSIGDTNIVWFSILGAVTAFIFVDRFEFIELTGWIANFALLVVLWYSMSNFIGGNSTAKLVSVANLVAYLQLVLLFQRKTPRLCWQILVLSILQIVVAAIFNLNFEYGIYFVLHFAAAIFSMGLQNDFSQWTRTQAKNKINLARADQTQTTATNLSPPVVFSKLQPSRSLRKLATYFIPWLFGSIAFAFILYHSLPHSPQEWESPSVRNFTGTGKSKSVYLDVDGIVPQTNQLVFRARFLDLKNNEEIIVNGEPYFRGMALNKLVYQNDVTSWEAPYDHIFDKWSYSKLDRFQHSYRSKNDVKMAGLEIIMEPVSDPLLYGTMPVYQRGTDSDVEFCRDISALTRRRAKTTNTIASYLYEVTTVLNRYGQPLNGWPYKTFKFGENFQGMEVDSPEYEMLTELDPQRYPTLLEIADKIAVQNSDKNRPELCQAMLKHFSASNRYSYTLDYRDVKKDRSLDPVEDFVQNHRTGHCALYASALTLMLRTQGIPARYVIGFYGGSYNSLTKCYVVHGRHAHAWVEAYIPFEQCTEEMKRQSIAGLGGSWVSLDPTPVVDSFDSNEALDLARSIWQDYVISPDHNKQNFNGDARFLGSEYSNSMLIPYYDDIVSAFNKNRLLQILFFSFVLLFFALVSYRNRTVGKSNSVVQTFNKVRSALSSAVSIISPKLGNWVSGAAKASIPFYVKLERLLEKHYDLHRAPHQTHLEFARHASESISEIDINPSRLELMKYVLLVVTNAFNQARFSAIPLDKTTVDDIENQIKKLEQLFHNSKTEAK